MTSAAPLPASAPPPAADLAPVLSVVVPVLDEAENVIPLLDEIEAALAPRGGFEVIFVDDSAIDASPRLLDELAAAHGWITAIHLMRNFGQHAATIAGIIYSSGDWVVTMDEDL
jgi:glycosyltransferase involved in cell wall biosynthesis